MQKKCISSVVALLALPLFAVAQSPISGFMNGKGHGAVALSYSSESYDKVLLVPNDAQGVPIFNKVNVYSKSLYASYGISNKFDAVLGLPYIKTEGHASDVVLNELGYENVRSGVQDVSVFVKYNPYNCKVGKSDLRFIIGAGVKTPMGKYKVDEGLQSILAIGNRATTFNGVGIAQLRTPSGIFFTTQAGYSVRNGDVPNALFGEIKAGYAAKRFYADFWYAGQVSDGGVNILGEGFTGFFPATDVSYNRLGMSIYVPIVRGFGISVGGSKYINGRNIGSSTGYTAGLAYNF